MELYLPLFVAIFAILILLLALLSQLTFEKKQIRLERMGEKPIILTVEIADNPFKRSLGLMFRTALGEHEGMLFIFPDESPRSFWMFNTKIPLDALYFNKNKEIVDIISMNPCTSLVCPTYPSSKRSQYVLEVNKGFAAKYAISSSSTLHFR